MNATPRLTSKTTWSEGLGSEARRSWGELRSAYHRARDAYRRAHLAIVDPPYRPPGSQCSPIPGKGDTAWAIRPQPPVVGINLREEEQLGLVSKLADHWTAVPDEPLESWRFRESWYFGRADAIVYHALLRTLRPARVLEVGSGYTSALALDTRERFLPELELTFIDPHPERLYGLLRQDDRRACEIIPERVQEVPLEVFDRLEPGDILFCDTEHFVKAGSEVNWLVFNVLPRIAPGVIVHFHDIFWPFEYTRDWLEEARAYNELYLIRAWLTGNPEFSIVLFNHWLWSEHPDLFAAVRPSIPSSLWLRKDTASAGPARP